jgi:ribonuclease-3
MCRPAEELEQKLGYRFKNRELLLRALTHRSSVSDRMPALETRADNEQLEFLGDSILGFIASETLVRDHPEANEGRLSQWKSQLVSSAHLHRCARALELGDFLVLGKGEERSGGRERRTLLSNALEAIIAAIHLDAGLDTARRFVENHVLKLLDYAAATDAGDLLNLKSILQERAQACGLPTPTYTTVSAAGPEHAKVFTVEARVGSNLVGRGCGSSKKEASRKAAEVLLAQMTARDEQRALQDSEEDRQVRL